MPISPEQLELLRMLGFGVPQDPKESTKPPKELAKEGLVKTVNQFADHLAEQFHVANATQETHRRIIETINKNFPQFGQRVEPVINSTGQIRAKIGSEITLFEKMAWEATRPFLGEYSQILKWLPHNSLELAQGAIERLTGEAVVMSINTVGKVIRTYQNIYDTTNQMGHNVVDKYKANFASIRSRAQGAVDWILRRSPTPHAIPNAA